MPLHVGSALDIGRRRSDNQEAPYQWAAAETGLFIVADG